MRPILYQNIGTEIYLLQHLYLSNHDNFNKENNTLITKQKFGNCEMYIEWFNKR